MSPISEVSSEEILEKALIDIIGNSQESSWFVNISILGEVTAIS